MTTSWKTIYDSADEAEEPDVNQALRAYERSTSKKAKIFVLYAEDQARVAHEANGPNPSCG